MLQLTASGKYRLVRGRLLALPGAIDPSLQSNDGSSTRRVSFCDGENKIWRPVLHETLDEHLARVFYFHDSSDERRVSKVAVQKVHEFLQRSAFALGMEKTYLVHEKRFTRGDSSLWAAFLKVSVSLDELNEHLPNRYFRDTGFVFTKEYVHALANLASNPKAVHSFQEESSAIVCFTCKTKQVSMASKVWDKVQRS